MENIYKFNNVIIFFLIITFAFSITIPSYAKAKKKKKAKEEEGIPYMIDLTEEEIIQEGKKFPKRLYPPETLEAEFTESSFRRFEIIFFLSLPFVIGYQFLFNQLLTSNYSINGQRSGKLSGQQWVYMGIATLLLCSGIAFNDYMTITDDQAKSESAMYYPSSNNRHINSFRFTICYNFYF